MLVMLLRIGIFILIAFTFVWVSIFLYVTFYYSFVPSIQHVRPVNLQFEPCDSEKKGMCSFPTAHIQLTKANQLLMIGQPYRILVELEMPESPVNINLGMFMVCGRLVGRGGQVVAHSCRSAMLRYYSPIVRALSILVFAPFYISGNVEEKQTFDVELFPHHEEDQAFPITDVFLEIKSREIEIYSSKLYVNAHLSGLRYIMFHYPVLSALFGTSFILFCIMFMALLSWWHVYVPYLKGQEFEKLNTKGIKNKEIGKEEVSSTDDKNSNLRIDSVPYEDTSDSEDTVEIVQVNSPKEVK